MSDDLLKQIGQRARLREAGARRIESSRAGDARLADPGSILSALDAQRSAERPVTRIGTNRRGWAAAAVATLAAAAAVVLAIRVGPAGAPMDYVVSVNGRVETTRSAQVVASTTLEARDDSMQEVLVRPREAVHAKVVASVLVVREGARIPTGLAPEVSDLGAVRFEVAGPMLRGATALIVVLTSPANTRDVAEIRIPVEPGEEKD